MLYAEKCHRCTMVHGSHWIGRPNEPLNTTCLKEFYRDRLERQYGKEASIDVQVYPEIVKDDGRERIAGLIFYGTVDGLLVLETLGTYAISHISEELPESIRKIHKKIAAGELIGETFNNDDYDIGRNSLDLLEMKNSKDLKRVFRTGSEVSKAYISQFLVCNRNSNPIVPVVYADFAAEIQSPDNTPPVTYFEERSRKSALASNFRKLGIYTPEIWRMIGNGLRHDEFSEKFHNARIASRDAIVEFERHVKSLLEDPNNFYKIIQKLEASDESIAENLSLLAKKYPRELYPSVV